MEEDNDLIVEEVPVFLSKNLQDNLYLFQYPSKSNAKSLESATIVNCCVKPINQIVKVDFALSVDSKFYDKFKGEQLAIAADGKNPSKNDKPTFRSGFMDKLSYISSKSIEDVDKYAVGIFQDGEIHLSPLASIVQLRPTFSYFDKQDKRTKADMDIDSDREEDIQKIKVKFTTNAESDRVKKAREKSYGYFMKKSSEEPWCETMWHSKKSPTSELEKQKIFTTKSQLIDHSLSLNSNQYIEKLIPCERSDQSLEAILPSKVIHKMKLKTLTLTEKLKTLLKDARMLQFNQIMSILEECEKQVPVEKVLRALPLVGVLIRGNWVLQSEILYPTQTASNANGVPSELMVRARNYILYKFSKQEYLHRRQVIHCTQLPPEETLEILQSVARLNAEKTWELLLPNDTSFETRYQELVQRQEMLWRASENLYHEMDYEKSPKRVRKRSIRETK